MKKLLICAFIFCGFFLKAQPVDNNSWCPPGASWVYLAFSQNSRLYYEFNYTKDTLVLGINAKKIEVNKIEYSQTLPPPNPETRYVSAFGVEIMYNSNDSVFLYDKGSFHFIYDFTPNLGDSLEVDSIRSKCPDNGFPAKDTLIVDSLYQLVFGSSKYDMVRFRGIKGKSNYYYSFGDLIKNIGPISKVFGNVSQCNSNFSLNSKYSIYTSLTCYNDNLRGSFYYNTGNSSTCYDIKTAVFEHNLTKKSISIYPNPSHKILNLSFPEYVETATYGIYNIQGKLCITGNTTNANHSITTTSLPKGLYIITIQYGNANETHKFIKQ